MKLVRFGPPGRETPGILLDDRILDVRAMSFDLCDYDAHFFSTFGLQRLQALLTDPGAKYVDAAAVRLGPPTAAPGKIICVGINYRDHAGECEQAVPE